MKFLRVWGPFLIFILTVIPVYLWFPQANFQNMVTTFRSLGQLCAIIGVILICIEFILSARIRFLENLFFGLNRMYIIHAFLGSVGFTLILLHPLFLTLGYLKISVVAAALFLTPTLSNIGVLVGMLALALMTVLLILTLYVRLEYDAWKRTHRWLGLVMVLISAHAFLENDTFAPSKTLMLYMYSFYFVGIWSFIYKQFSRRLGVNVYEYSITNVKVKNDVVMLDATPTRVPMSYQPGQFAFIDFKRKGVERQSHPFSIVSSPDVQDLSFAIRSLGDFTETLKLLSPGTPMTIEGPFGRFSYKYFKNKNQIWIAGGIGVTPFMSMVRSLPVDSDLNILFIYSVKTAEEALYVDELNQKSSEIKNLKFDLFIAKDSGMLTAATVNDQFNLTLKPEIFICGPPPMMHALRQQFKKFGIKNGSIHTEEFSLS